MAVELYNRGGHACIAFYDLVDDQNDAAVQANQFLIVDDGHGALVDPGGNITYNGLLMAMQRYVPSRELDLILASHADPDIIASVNKWFVATHCRVLISQLWTRFVPHFTTGRDVSGRIVGIPDPGGDIPLGRTVLKAVPAHFLHSEGNFQFYDPVSKILFTGDMGASLVPHELAAEPVRDFDAHVPYMEAFHRRYMISNKICRFWVDMVRKMDVSMLVPQHGSCFEGPMIGRFLDWIEALPCGVDLMTAEHYQFP